MSSDLSSLVRLWGLEEGKLSGEIVLNTFIATDTAAKCGRKARDVSSADATTVVDEVDLLKERVGKEFTERYSQLNQSRKVCNEEQGCKLLSECSEVGGKSITETVAEKKQGIAGTLDGSRKDSKSEIIEQTTQCFWCEYFNHAGTIWCSECGTTLIGSTSLLNKHTVECPKGADTVSSRSRQSAHYNKPRKTQTSLLPRSKSELLLNTLCNVAVETPHLTKPHLRYRSGGLRKGRQWTTSGVYFWRKPSTLSCRMDRTSSPNKPHLPALQCDVHSNCFNSTSHVQVENCNAMKISEMTNVSHLIHAVPVLKVIVYINFRMTSFHHCSFAYPLNCW